MQICCTTDSYLFFEDNKLKEYKTVKEMYDDNEEYRTEITNWFLSSTKRKVKDLSCFIYDDLTDDNHFMIDGYFLYEYMQQLLDNSTFLLDCELAAYKKAFNDIVDLMNKHLDS